MLGLFNNITMSKTFSVIFISMLLLICASCGSRKGQSAISDQHWPMYIAEAHKNLLLAQESPSTATLAHAIRSMNTALREVDELPEPPLLLRFCPDGRIQSLVYDADRLCLLLMTQHYLAAQAAVIDRMKSGLSGNLSNYESSWEKESKSIGCEKVHIALKFGCHIHSPEFEAELRRPLANGSESVRSHKLESKFSSVPETSQ